MALVKCVECGKDISDKATSCPNCGCPMQSMATTGPINTFKGINGTIILYQNRVELRREGFLGIGRGDSVIPLSQISNVYVYNGNILNGGYIQFLTAGETNSKDLNTAIKADNAVAFQRKDKDKIAELKNKIYEIK